MGERAGGCVSETVCNWLVGFSECANFDEETKLGNLVTNIKDRMVMVAIHLTIELRPYRF